METSITISKTDLKRLDKVLKNVDPGQRAGALYKSFRIASLDMENALKRSVTGKYLKVRSGLFRNSIQNVVRFSKSMLSAVIGSGVRTGERMSYANVHESGGTISAKNGKYLTVPLDKNKTRAGVARKKARDLTDSFVFRSKKDNLIMAEKIDQKIVPMFVLKENVKIKGKKYLSNTLRTNKSKFINRLIDTIKTEANK
jgi:hypothetical protein